MAEKKEVGVGSHDLSAKGVVTRSHVSPGGDTTNLSKRRPEDLTPRELEILGLIWDGHTNRSIAEHLSISMKTADTHRANMMKKLRASNTAQLLKAALEGKFLRADDGGKGSDGAK